MNGTEYHRKLGIGESAFDALTDHLEERSYDGLEYRHVPDYRQGVERGTALIAGEVVRGFPKIPRTLVLETGIPNQFDGEEEIAVEEKLNGYNVRFARIDGDVLAFSRSGMVCPFTTRIADRVVDLDPLFDAHPEATVCGEMIGPENPYTAHDYPGVDSIAFRAFDWRDRRTGEPLAVSARRERYEEFDVPQTQLFGTYDVADAAAAVDRIVRGLDAEDREGVVMKSPDCARQLKYTTSASNRGDLAYAFSLPFDYGREFVFRRLIREGFQTVERGESDHEVRERARDLGEAILLSMRESIETVDAGGTVGERHTVRASEESIDVLLEHLRGQGLRIEIEADRREDGERVVTFRKRTQATNDKIRNYLDGHIARE
ncbi:RNA ligase [Halosolutus gelatinilyticus]|uniref:RNA ligase n=1 Tax=Halosolutus gelatinilyticus TaxID=2931975 RepID=UPI001FF5DF3E|nr:RNA ligase [Halosolutus gelatinilyticus]